MKKTKERSTATPYDDAFKTLLVDCKELVLPVMNEVFGEHYEGNEQIVFTQNEHFMQMPDGEQAKRITDATFMVIGKETKQYLYECQSSVDNSILIRIFEYMTQTALESSVLEDNKLEVHFSNCVILYLRSNRNLPEQMELRLYSVEGDSISIAVKVMKMEDYSLETILEKDLMFLLPFYFFRYEKDFPLYEREEEAREKLLAECRKVISCLNEKEAEKKINVYEKRAILEILRKVTKNLTRKYKKVWEGVSGIMGGEVLEYEAKTILRKGIAQGIEQGVEIGIQRGECNGMIQTCLEFGITKDEIIDRLQKRLKGTKEEAQRFFEEFQNGNSLSV